jgi:hypothetical protein
VGKLEAVPHQEKSTDSLIDVNLFEVRDAKSRLRAAVGKNKTFLQTRTTQNHAFFNNNSGAASNGRNMISPSSPIKLTNRNVGSPNGSLENNEVSQRISLQELSRFSQNLGSDIRKEMFKGSQQEFFKNRINSKAEKRSGSLK